jgi:hypothetical protein
VNVCGSLKLLYTTQDQSAFQIDLQEILFCIKYTTNRSLILLDEFGKVNILLHLLTTAATELTHLHGIRERDPAMELLYFALP